MPIENHFFHWAKNEHSTQRIELLQIHQVEPQTPTTYNTTCEGLSPQILAWLQPPQS
jgi:hypothetical protein